jgi:hypothetical protein
MMRLKLPVAALVVLTTVTMSQPAAAQSDQTPIDLVVGAGRPLRVELDERVQLKHIGQSVTGTVVQPVYAYDRIVIAKGTRVRGRIAGIDSGSKFVRARAYLAGNFSPPKQAVLQFDTLLLDDGQEVSIDTVVKGGIPNVKRETAGGTRSGGAAGAAESASTADVEHPTFMARARSELMHRAGDAVTETKQKASDTFAFIKSAREPGQMSRLKDAAVQQLPYHPQYLAKGTVYDAELAAPISFGSVLPAPAAPAGTAPAPDSLLTARLATTLDSSKTPRGTLFEAVITETVFSSDRKVIFPEGTKLTGEVTFAAPARRFHRNGKLRFLFESVQVPNQAPAPLVGALHAIDASSDDRVALDDEGGATLQNSNTRFIAPALAILALHASIERDGESHLDPDGDGTIKTAGSGAGARGVGGFIGMGFFGAAVSQITRPLGIAMGVYGAARTVYANILGKGREVTFPADTPIQVRLAPGPAAR